MSVRAPSPFDGITATNNEDCSASFRALIRKLRFSHAGLSFDEISDKNSLKNLASIYFSAKSARIIIPIWELR